MIWKIPCGNHRWLWHFIERQCTTNNIFKRKKKRKQCHHFFYCCICFRGGYINFWLCTVKNYHKVTGLKTHRFIIWKFCMSEVWNGFHWAEISCWHSHTSSRDSGEILLYINQLLGSLHFLVGTPKTMRIQVHKEHWAGLWIATEIL